MRLKDKIKFIYFDLDNTIWDFKKNTMIALQEVYNEKIKNNKINIDFNHFSDVYTNNNEKLWRALERGEITAEDLKIIRFDQTIKELGMIGLVKVEELNTLYMKNLVQLPNLIPNTRKILEYLVTKYKMGILSNGFNQSQHKKLSNSGIIQYFDPIITSDAAGVSKPHAKMFHYAIEKSGFKASEIAYVGDDYKVDILAANEVGITGILLDPKNNIKDDNIIKITDLVELKEYF